jgi:hypothetical protein
MVLVCRGLTILCGFSVAACTTSSRDSLTDTAGVAAPSSAVHTNPDPEGAIRAAKDIVGFLRGDVGFDKIRLADTVVLYVSPEGGGGRREFTREQLRTPSSWVVPSGRQTYTFAPPAHLTKVTAKAGRHFNCLEYALASRFPDLARLPHVGVKLEPDTLASCLQTWNTTFVFDASKPSPRLAAAVYDQWEW